MTSSRLYGDSVAIADTAGEFISACARALSETNLPAGAYEAHAKAHRSMYVEHILQRQIVAEIEAVLARQHDVTGFNRQRAPLLRPVPAHAAESQRGWLADRPQQTWRWPR